jgi:DNA primase
VSDSQIEEIKNKLDVLEVVGGYVKLTKTGINYRGACPFHKEKTPSFFVSPTRQMWHCFGCSKGGDIFEFIKDIEGIEFGDVLRILAKKAGVELKNFSKEDIKLKTERQNLYEIIELACQFFEKQLESSQVGKEAKEYLLKRGISDESIKKWRLGYSPDTWQGLSDFLISKGYQREEIIKSGLAIAKEGKNDSYDRFRGRIIFPIFDINSQIVGFGARIFKVKDQQETAKYINTPQTLLYDKSNLLYGLNFARISARKDNYIVLTEGYTDTIMCHQAGFESTVATSGTALTQQHLNILKRYTDNLILAFDMDSAGQNATKRGIDLAQEKGFNIKVIETYEAKDPADIILEDSGKWQEVLEKTKSIMDYYFDSAFLKNDKTKPEGKKEIAKIILPAIKRLQNKIEQFHWVSKLAGKLQTSESIILEELEKVKIVSVSQYQEQKQTFIGKNNLKDEVPTRKRLLEEKIMALLAKCPENISLIEDCHNCLFSENVKKFLENMKKNINSELVISDTRFSKEVLNENKTFLDVIALKQEVEELENLKEEDKTEILLCLEHLRDLELKNKRENLSKAIALAEVEDNHKEAEDLIKQFSELGK